MTEPEISLEALVQAWGARDWADFVETLNSGRFFAIDYQTGKTVKALKPSHPATP